MAAGGVDRHPAGNEVGNRGAGLLVCARSSGAVSDWSFRTGLRSSFIARQDELETLSLAGYNETEKGKKKCIDNICPP